MPFFLVESFKIIFKLKKIMVQSTLWSDQAASNHLAISRKSAKLSKGGPGGETETKVGLVWLYRDDS